MFKNYIEKAVNLLRKSMVIFFPLNILISLCTVRREVWNKLSDVMEDGEKNVVRM